eukprot:ctg_467.g119
MPRTFDIGLVHCQVLLRPVRAAGDVERAGVEPEGGGCAAVQHQEDVCAIRQPVQRLSEGVRVAANDLRGVCAGVRQLADPVRAVHAAVHESAVHHADADAGGASGAGGAADEGRARGQGQASCWWCWRREEALGAGATSTGSEASAKNSGGEASAKNPGGEADPAGAGHGFGDGCAIHHQAATGGPAVCAEHAQVRTVHARRLQAAATDLCPIRPEVPGLPARLQAISDAADLPAAATAGASAADAAASAASAASAAAERTGLVWHVVDGFLSRVQDEGHWCGSVRACMDRGKSHWVVSGRASSFRWWPFSSSRMRR